jgi:hypothetical protein
VRAAKLANSYIWSVEFEPRVLRSAAKTVPSTHNPAELPPIPPDSPAKTQPVDPENRKTEVVVVDVDSEIGATVNEGDAPGAIEVGICAICGFISSLDGCPKVLPRFTDGFLQKICGARASSGARGR